MRCPVCRAENGEDDSCRRCRADLSLLTGLERLRRRLLTAARRAAAAGQAEELLQHAAAADNMRRDAESTRLLTIARLLRRDFREAWQLFRMVQKSSWQV